LSGEITALEIGKLYEVVKLGELDLGSKVTVFDTIHVI